MKVMIDPGHAPGNANGGKVYKEYAGMWKLSNYLKNALERRGVEAALTRAENADPSLTKRGQAAAEYDLFVSQHSNAGGGAARGVEVYYSVRIPGDKNFAADISRAVAAYMGNPDRGAKTRESTVSKGYDYYTVMFEAVKAGAKHVLLCETGFHDNLMDEGILLNDASLAGIAEIQAAVICAKLGVVSAPAPAPENKIIWRVQAGAFGVRANAEAMLARMKAAGFADAFIKAD